MRSDETFDFVIVFAIILAKLSLISLFMRIVLNFVFIICASRFSFKYYLAKFRLSCSK